MHFRMEKFEFPQKPQNIWAKVYGEKSELFGSLNWVSKQNEQHIGERDEQSSSSRKSIENEFHCIKHSFVRLWMSGRDWEFLCSSGEHLTNWTLKTKQHYSCVRFTVEKTRNWCSFDSCSNRIIPMLSLNFIYIKQQQNPTGSYFRL